MSPRATAAGKKFPISCPSAPTQLSTPQKPQGRSRWGASPTQPILSRPFPDRNTGFGATRPRSPQQSPATTHSQGHDAQSAPQDFGAAPHPSNPFNPVDIYLSQLGSRRVTHPSDPRDQASPEDSVHMLPPFDRDPNARRPSPSLQLFAPTKSSNDRDGNGCSQQ